MKTTFKILLLVLCITAIAPAIVTAQEGSRIILLEKAAADDEKVYIELLSIKVGDKDVPLNQPFTVDKDWLKNLKMRVKNVSGKTIECAYVSFGILEGINDKLEPYMSWGWKWAVSTPGCAKVTAGKFKLKNGAEYELNHANTVENEKNTLKGLKVELIKPQEDFHQADFISATVYFQGELKKKGLWGNDSFMRIGPLVKYSEFQDN